MRILIHIVLLFLVFFPVLTNGARINRDSLVQVLHTTDLPSDKIEILILLAKSFADEDPTRSNNYASQALFISESINNEQGMAAAEYYLALYELKQNDYQKAFEYLIESREFLSKSDNLILLAKVEYELGNLYKRRLEFEKALDQLYQAESIFKDLNRQNRLARTYNAIGGIYYDQANYDKAYEYYQKSLEIYSNQNNISGISKLQNNIGEIYRLKNDHSSALSYYNQSLKTNTELNNINLDAILYNNIGSIYLEQEKLDSAALFLEKSLMLGKEINEPERISSAKVNLGKLYFKIEQFDKAKRNLQESYNIGIKDNNLLIIRNVSEILSKLYEKEGDYKKALLYFRQFRNANDSIRNIQNLEKITRMEMKFLFDHENEVRDIQVQKTNLVYFSIALGLIFLSVLIVLLYGRQRIRTSQLRIKADNLELERNQLQDELDYKNRELTTNVMYLVKKNELINFISDKLLKSKQNFATKNSKVIEQIVFDLQSGVDKNIWNVFQERFVEVHQDFFENLKYKFPNLTENEKRLCAFIRLNLNTKEIAAITHQNPQTVEVARTRLRKKLNISNTEISLNNFLAQL